MNIRKRNRNISAVNKRVFVGLSGGVDSAVSAALLKQEGYDVIGVFIKVWTPDFLPCSWREERRDAMRVALALDIPFLFLDFSEEYKRGVADYMIEEYKVGRTPNPDVLCNREIKFGAFWREAQKRGADFIATGHYLSGEKDQSYFLWTLTQEDYAHTLFPVGHMEKSEVRKLAKKFNLPVAEKKDSQGICFIGDVSLEDFLSHFIETKPGKVLDTKGKVIGKHNGALYYTIGERHGFEVIEKGADAGAFYVVAKDMKANTITVSSNMKEIESHAPKRVKIKNVNWLKEPEGPDLLARIRYRGKKVSVELKLEKKNLIVEFKEPEVGLSLGQSIVFYNDETLLGGAILDKILN
ncbi:MAG: tRNA 2-thiouridine(34) synthase MnmA [bacterium]|nr:tRNA 2-thiouridine(34) synthase MnmA [bacterium]